MRRKREVAQNEIVVLEIETGKEVLFTEGVSTCICILAKGQYGTHPFLAMYHWDGFSDNFRRQDLNAMEYAKWGIQSVISVFIEKIKHSFFSLYPNEKPELETMYIIGGEKGTPDLSGTELEVLALKLFLPEFCNAYFSVHSETKLFYKNFLTNNFKTQSINISFCSHSIDLAFDKFEINDEMDITSQESQDTESKTSNESPQQHFKI